MTDLDDIRSNGRRVCADCGRPITPETDSGWEVFVAPRVTQPVCNICWDMRHLSDPPPADDDEVPRH